MEHAFLVEGFKNVEELLLSDYKTLRLFSVASYAPLLAPLAQKAGLEVEIVSERELEAIGTLSNNHTALAIAATKEYAGVSIPSHEWTIALDGINDPGNLGTIIRIADWYGIGKILCSTDSVDVYNPKVINASKGSFTRVEVHYLDLEQILAKAGGVPILAACMEGRSIYRMEETSPAVILMGNEANGIREPILRYATQKVNIPKRGKAESLNVGVATGILVDRLLGGR